MRLTTKVAIPEAFDASRIVPDYDNHMKYWLNCQLRSAQILPKESLLVATKLLFRPVGPQTAPDRQDSCFQPFYVHLPAARSTFQRPFECAAGPRMKLLNCLRMRAKSGGSSGSHISCWDSVIQCGWPSPSGNIGVSRNVSRGTLVDNHQAYLLPAFCSEVMDEWPSFGR